MKAIIRISVFILSFVAEIISPHVSFAQNFDGDTLGARRSGIYPLPIFFYTPETGFAGGAAALYLHWDTAKLASRPSDVTGDLIYTEKKQIIVEINGDFYFAAGLYRLLTDTWYKNFPNSFYGIGNNVSSSARESYISKAYIAKIVLYRTIFSKFNLAPLLQFESSSTVQTRPGGLLESGTIPGSSGGVVSGGGIVANWDSRDNTFAAYSGSFYQFTAVVNGKSVGSNFNYTDISLDTRNFFELMPSQIMAVQTTTQIIDGTAPFQDLAGFGGQDFLRGYFDGQYRDKTEVGGQIEYRVPVWWRFGAVAFAGVAQVADKVSLWSFNEFKFAGGAGIRFLLKRDDRIALRLDMGFGSNSSGVYLTVTEAF
ncbi:MAG: BamA/TamA family outer membrane protein [Bacteroidota bacterium]